MLIMSNQAVFSAFFLLCMMAAFLAHEAGHLLMARLFKVHVAHISLGFGREVWGRTDKYGTRWSINIFPFCGMVQLTDPDSNRSDDFTSRPAWQRFFMVLGGPGASLGFALALFIGFYALVGQPATLPVVTGVEQSGPGDRAGIELHDHVIRFNGRKINRYEDVTALLNREYAAPVSMIVMRGDKTVRTTIQPEWIEYTDLDGFHRAHSRLGLLAQHKPLALDAIRAVDDIDAPDAGRVRNLLLDRVGKQAVLRMRSSDGGTLDFRVFINGAMNDRLNKDASALYLGAYKGDVYIMRTFSEAFIDGLNSFARLTSGAVGTAKNLWPMDYRLITPETIVRNEGFGLVTDLHILIFVTAFLSICIGLLNLMPFRGLDGHWLLLYGLEMFCGKTAAARLHPYAWRLAVTVVSVGLLLSNLEDVQGLITTSIAPTP